MENYNITKISELHNADINNAESDNIKSNSIESNSIESNSIESNSIESNSIESNSIESNSIESNSIESDNAKSTDFNLDNYELDSFKKDLEELNIRLDERQLCHFMKYYELLIEWNKVMNLTTITDINEVLKKHFIDSLSLIKIYSVNSEMNSEISSELYSSASLIDIGTGAGFPGIPLKIAFPELRITLLDSLNKRVNFLQTVIDELGLKDIEVIHGRAEDFSKKGMLREKYDLCVSRAVANLSTLSEYCLPYVKVGGKFISYKSEKITEEIASAKKAISVLGGKIENQVEFIIPNSDIYRNLVIIGKEKKTSDKYPRKAGVPAKSPIT